MQQLTVCNSRGIFLDEVNIDDIDQIKGDADKTLWLDLVNPGADDIEVLRREFGFHPLAIKDATRRQGRPKVDSYQDYYFVVFYCLHADETSERIMVQPLFMFIGKNYLVTVHPDPIPEIKETLRRWREPNSPLGQDVGALIYALLDAIVDEYFPTMDHVADRIERLEELIFGDFKEDALQEIFSLKKDLLGVRRVVAPERDVLNVMLRRDIPVFGPDDVTYLQDVYDHIVRVLDSIDSYRDLLGSSLDSFLSVQSNRLNQVVKALTVTSIVLMSVTLVAGIYGMNFDYMPELHWRFGYAWALGLMVAIAGGLVGFFRYIEWL